MEQIFLRILNMSISAGWLVLAVIAMRLLLRRAPKWLRVVMWGLVGLRLVCPVSFKSVLSLIPSAETVPYDIGYAQQPAVNSGIEMVNNAVNPVIGATLSPNIGDSVNPAQLLTSAGTFVWLIGMAVMLICAAVSSLRLRRRVAPSVRLAGNVYICDDINMPFIFGIVKPRIYLPSDLGGEQRGCVLAHERAHIARRDHLWKPLGYALLAVYWFNPLMWAAYILLSRDIELACDERVIMDMDKKEKQAYSTALLTCSVSRGMISVCPLAFGEVGVKERVKSVFDYKKPALWIIIAAIVLCGVLTVCFLTDPVSSKLDGETEQKLHELIIDRGYSPQREGVPCEDHIVLGTEKNGDKQIIYAIVWYGIYQRDAEGEISEQSGWHVPARITFEDGKPPHYEEPRDGSYYVDDIKHMFPLRLRRKALNVPEYSDEQDARCRKQAETFFALVDIGGMNVTGSTPNVIYADENTVAVKGEFGVIVFDVKRNRITNAVSAEQIRNEYGIETADWAALADGSKLVFGNIENQFSSIKRHYDFSFDVKTGEIKSLNSSPELYRTERLEPLENEVLAALPESLGGRFTSENAARFGDILCFATIETNGEMRTLHIVMYNEKTGKGEVFSVFGESFGAGKNTVSEDEGWVSMRALDITPEGMKLVIESQLDEEGTSLITGDEYSIMRRVGSDWVEVDRKADAVWHMIGYAISKDNPFTSKIDWTWLYGSLPEGEYKLTKEITRCADGGEPDAAGSGDYSERAASIVFTIGGEHILSPDAVADCDDPAAALGGSSRDELLEAWGEPAGELFGMYGEIWPTSDGRYVIVYYDFEDDFGNAYVCDVKINKADKTE